MYSLRVYFNVSTDYPLLLIFHILLAKLLHFFELCKSSVKKMPLMFENTNGITLLIKFTVVPLKSNSVL